MLIPLGNLVSFRHCTPAQFPDLFLLLQSLEAAFLFQESLSFKFARAARLVVVSAGTFGSPPILERSGVGAKATLEKYGVVQVVDLPGVGENYQGM